MRSGPFLYVVFRSIDVIIFSELDDHTSAYMPWEAVKFRVDHCVIVTCYRQRRKL